MEERYSLARLTLSQQQSVFGELDCHIRKLERALSVSILSRDGELRISGEPSAVHRARAVIDYLCTQAGRDHEIEEQTVDYAISLSSEQPGADTLPIPDEQVICHTASGKPVKAKTIGQQRYVDAIRDHMITFGIGPAGTGKTYLAMAMAITAFKNGEVERLVLTRPAIEAGEKLGFLPGDLQSKIDPYLRPLYDALYQIMGAEGFNKNMERGLIEVAPLAYMRGRTLDNAYIILDEAQNTTRAQMKMFLTRIGFGSKVVVTGDATQKDLPHGTVSGLDVAQRVLGRIEGISFIRLGSVDVVRHPLVQKIVKAYEHYEEEETKQIKGHKGNGRSKKR